jgi:16S rRNA (guanine966-N2)-methyltransferase
MYRIISGKWKGKKIAAPKNFEVRPTTDFAKEALFSILENKYDLEFCSTLDLFAGIASISFEFASRGCNDVTAVEMNPKHIGFIHATASELEMSLQINIQRADVYDWLKKNKNKKQYDIIFADPPFMETDESKYMEMLNFIETNKYSKPNGIVILEHQSRLKILHESLIESRKYGNITFSFFQFPIEEDAIEI